MDPLHLPSKPILQYSIPDRLDAISATPDNKSNSGKSIDDYVRVVREAIVGQDNAPQQAPLIDRSSEARQKRSEAARAAIARIKAIRNGPEEDDGEFLRELDEANPGRFDLARFYADGIDPT